MGDVVYRLVCRGLACGQSGRSWGLVFMTIVYLYVSVRHAPTERKSVLIAAQRRGTRREVMLANSWTVPQSVIQPAATQVASSCQRWYTSG